MKGHGARFRVGTRQNHDLKNRTGVGRFVPDGDFHRRPVVIDHRNDQGNWAGVQGDALRQIHLNRSHVGIGRQQFRRQRTARTQRPERALEQGVQDDIRYLFTSNQFGQAFLSLCPTLTTFMSLHEVDQLGHRLQQVQAGGNVAPKQGQPGIGGFLGGVLDVRVIGRLQVVHGGFKHPGVLFAATLKQELIPFLGPFQRG